MDNAKLTKAADEILCGLFDVFLQREKGGELRATARCFAITRDFQADILRELKSAGFIRKIGWDRFALEDAAIVYMESRPTRVDTAIDLLTRIKNAIPFI